MMGAKIESQKHLTASPAPERDAAPKAHRARIDPETDAPADAADAPPPAAAPPAAAVPAPAAAPDDV